MVVNLLLFDELGEILKTAKQEINCNNSKLLSCYKYVGVY